MRFRVRLPCPRHQKKREREQHHGRLLPPLARYPLPSPLPSSVLSTTVGRVNPSRETTTVQPLTCVRIRLPHPPCKKMREWNLRCLRFLSSYMMAQKGRNKNNDMPPVAGEWVQPLMHPRPPLLPPPSKKRWSATGIIDGAIRPLPLHTPALPLSLAMIDCSVLYHCLHPL